MTRILTSVLSIHWTAVFALLAWSDGAILFGAPIVAGSQALSIAVSSGFGLVAALFLWLLLSALLDRDPRGVETGEVARIAFSGAALAMTLVGARAAIHAPGLVMTTVALQLAALLTSYLAIASEIRSLTGQAPRDDVAKLAARFKALGAVRETVLGRSGRAPAGEIR